MVLFDQDALITFAAEVNGEVHDRPLRRAIDSKIRDFFLCFDTADWDGVEEHLSPNAKLIDKLVDPGHIHTGNDSIIDWLTLERGVSQHTIHHLLLVDRGRVTCYVSTFWTNKHDLIDQCDDKPQFGEERDVYIIDLDDQQQIKRIERRANDSKILEHDGDLVAMENAAAEAEKHAMQMKEII
ncbi:hypothetical protein CI238_06813 [Colletotrichum incanum]|uniref:Uncharacterized protein n=1 Tax=Colletotrichum incanum TaxID=1573173 RepID=A0A167DVP0_COLIC|nr:hypothetical protein CI238_06813 [Colletotrichum incanum]OHW93671.1 hypothetical protein CSPAE12_07704 [Colletotrichum incanum]